MVRGRRKGQRWLAAVIVIAAATTGAAEPRRPDWPPFLPPRDMLRPDLVSAVELIWTEPTLVRTVRGRTAEVPFETYAAFVDAPDVTAAAARHLKLAKYDVEALGDGWFRADDHDGSRGIYYVVDREGQRRVILSWGEHTGRILRGVGGSALSLLELEPDGDRVKQRISAYVHIDNAVLATLARMLVPMFGSLADRKLVEGFTVTANVAEWAVRHPDDFCSWLDHEGGRAESRTRIAAAFADCSCACASGSSRPSAFRGTR